MLTLAMLLFDISAHQTKSPEIQSEADSLIIMFIRNLVRSQSCSQSLFSHAVYTLPKRLCMERHWWCTAGQLSKIARMAPHLFAVELTSVQPKEKCVLFLFYLKVQLFIHQESFLSHRNLRQFSGKFMCLLHGKIRLFQYPVNGAPMIGWSYWTPFDCQCIYQCWLV